MIILAETNVNLAEHFGLINETTYLLTNLKTMSTRTYRVIKKELAKTSSFNLSHDKELISFFEQQEGYYEYLNQDRGGVIEISTNLLDKALKEFQWEKEDPRINAIKEDIAFAKEKKDDYIIYECF